MRGAAVLRQKPPAAKRTSEITLSVRISMIRLGHQDITQQSARRNAPQEKGGAPLDILGPRQGFSMSSTTGMFYLRSFV